MIQPPNFINCKLTTRIYVSIQPCKRKEKAKFFFTSFVFVNASGWYPNIFAGNCKVQRATTPHPRANSVKQHQMAGQFAQGTSVLIPKLLYLPKIVTSDLFWPFWAQIIMSHMYFCLKINIENKKNLLAYM